MVTGMEVVRYGKNIEVPHIDERLGDLEFWIGTMEYDGKLYEVEWGFIEDEVHESVDDYDWLNEDCVLSVQEVI